MVASVGNNCTEFTTSLLTKNSGISTRKDTNKTGGFISQNSFKNKYFAIADQAIQEALDDAKISRNELNQNHRIGMVLGTSLANIGIFENNIRYSVKTKKTNMNNSRLITGTIGYLLLHLRRKYKISGPGYILSNTCVSGINTISLGCQLINRGQVDYCIIGSLDVISDLIYYGMKSLNALSEKKELQPFSAVRDGMLLGEGSGFIIVTNQKGKTSYGKIAGYAITNDGKHLTAPDREGKALIMAIDQSMAMAGLEVSELDCIFCGGTGTSYNDAMQAFAIKYIEKKSGISIPVTSIKSLIGHTLGASGTIESIAALIMMKKGFLISIGSNYALDPSLAPIPVIQNMLRGEINKTILLSSGFSGVNGVLVLKKDL